MKRIKVSELSGAALDWAVAKCEGKNGVLHDDGITRCIVIAAPSGVYKGTWRPSLNWSQGGPIMEREKIGVWFQPEYECWLSSTDKWLGANVESEEFWTMPSPSRGPEPLIAAMRCYVASKLGDVIEIPDDLT